jgi:glycosidase
MQWNAEENAGFSAGKPWLPINANCKYINYASQKHDPDSVLSFYKALILLRKESQCLKYGEFLPLYADNRLMIYQRKLEEEIYTAAFNFSSGKIQLPKKVNLSGTIVISNTGRKTPDRMLLPWEGILIVSATF